jgi:hypothetical protein
MDREMGGVGPKIPMPFDFDDFDAFGVLASFTSFSAFSGLSDVESFDELFSSLFLLDLDRFTSGASSSDFFSVADGDLSALRSFDGFFSSFLGVAPHVAHEDPSALTTLARSFFKGLDSSGGGVGI